MVNRHHPACLCDCVKAFIGATSTSRRIEQKRYLGTSKSNDTSKRYEQSLSAYRESAGTEARDWLCHVGRRYADLERCAACPVPLTVIGVDNHRLQLQALLTCTRNTLNKINLKMVF